MKHCSYGFTSATYDSFFFFAARVSISLKNMEEIHFQMFTPGQYLKKNCDFLKI